MTKANPKVNEAALWLATTWRHHQRPIGDHVLPFKQNHY